MAWHTALAQEAELKWVEGMGNTRWANSMTPSTTDFQLDGEGNIYVIGHFNSGNTWLDGTDVDPVHFPCLMSSIYGGLYIAKLDSNGNRIWAKTLRSSLKLDLNTGPALRVSNLVLKDSLLYFTFYLVGHVHNGYQMCVPPFIWFFDTLFTFPVTPDNPYEGSNYQIPDSLRKFPFNFNNGSIINIFVTMDLDGNLKDIHSAEVGYDYTERENEEHMALVMESPCIIDSKKNHHFFYNFPEGSYTIFDDDTTKRIYTPYIDSTTNRHSPFIPPSGLSFLCSKKDSISRFVHVIVDSNYNIISAKPVFSHVDNPQVFYQTPTVTPLSPLLMNTIISGNNLTIDNEDNVYLRATLQTFHYSYSMYAQQGSTYLDSTGEYVLYHEPAHVDYPYHIYLDSAHYITVENFQASNCLPVIIKYDNHGNILWCNQLYTSRQDSINNHSEGDYPKLSVAVDSHYVYVPWDVFHSWIPKFDLGINISDSANWWLIPQDTLLHKDYYFDEEHLHRYDAPEIDTPIRYRTTPDSLRMWYNRNIIAVYDRETGEFIRYFDPLMMAAPYYDSINKNTDNFLFNYSYLVNRLILQDNKLYIRELIRNTLIHPNIFHYRLLQYDTRTDECVVIDSTMHAGGNAHYMGLDGRYIFSTYYGEISRYTPQSPVMDSLSGSLNLNSYSPIFACYYLPDCDTRRQPPCPPVDSLTATRTAPSTISLAWAPDPAHTAWQVAQLPSTDSLPDSTAWESALVTETETPSLTLDIDTCTLLRVRGICSSGNYGPWSNPVEACPAVGINSQLSALNFQLTPNPATGSVTVVDSRSGAPLRYVKEIQVISPLGQTLLHLRGTNRFNVSTLPAATYLVKVVTRHSTHLLKLVVE
jgi:hypothetical protein